ncbi:MAG TPA: imelysin family protein [Flavobacteriales bacterium]
MNLKIWMLAILGAILLSACTLSGCSKDEKPEDGPGSNFDRATLLQDLSRNVIVPAYAQANTAAIALQQAMEQFATGANQANLDAARAAWNTMMDAWMACEMFHLGPQYAENLDQRIAYSPINTALIESEISGNGPVDAEYIAGTGVTRKGLHATEYLLYGAGDNDPSVLEGFILGAHAERRRTYLRSLSMDIAARINVVHQAWQPTGGNHTATFNNATQSDINGSLNLMVNAWIENIERTRRDKVQAPSGIEMGGTPQPMLAENRASGRSMANIRIAIAQWKRVFTSGDGLGMDDNLNAIDARYQGEPLAAKVLSELDLALTNCAAITLPLDQAVEQQPAEVNALYLTLKRLTVLTKIDVASNLGVIVTFSDNDGD